MTETNKKLSRREAIKIVGAAAGASLLANIPAKWSKPELSGADLPAHAQTSNCPAGSSTLSLSVVGDGSVSIYNSLIDGGPTPYPTGLNTTINTGCVSECFYIEVTSEDSNTVTVVGTLNGSIVFGPLTYSSTNFHFAVNGATGGSAIDGNPDGCNIVF